MHDTQKNRLRLKKWHKRRSIQGNQLKFKTRERRHKRKKSELIRTLRQFLIKKSFPVKRKLERLRRSHSDKSLSKGNEVKIPKEFSFSTNPDQTIVALRKVASSIVRDKSHTIVIDFGQCQEMDLAACCILSSILMGSEKYFEKKGMNLLAKGINLQTDVGQMVVISGLIKHLDLEGQGEEERKIEETKILMPLLTKKTSKKDPVGEIIRYLEKCFNAEGFQLTEHGNQMMGDIVGEVFSNIGDHNEGFKEWYAIGHAIPTEEHTMVHLAIMNYGVSFYESFQQGNTENFAKKQVECLFEKQRTKYPSLSEELYITLLCLQKNISRCREGKRSTRGQGLIELLDNLMKIGEYNKKNRVSIMSITTGHISVIFDGEEIVDRKERVYLGKKLDYLKSKEKYFKELKNAFPGAVISMKFALNRNYIKGVIEENGKD